MGSEKREYYRSTPEGDTDLSVVVVAGDRRMQTMVTDVSVGGIGISVSGVPATSRLAQGDQVTLEISAPCLPAHLKTPGLIQHADARGTEYVYGVKFVDWLGLLEAIPVELARFFNRRGAPRVEPPEKEVLIYFELDGVARVVHGMLADLSRDGLAFEVPTLEGRRLEKALLVLVSFKLPNSTEHLSFRAQLRHLLTGERVWRYGAFFSDAARNFEAKRRKLAEHLAKIPAEDHSVEFETERS